jgi:hypothetical protein
MKASAAVFHHTELPSPTNATPVCPIASLRAPGAIRRD